MDLQSDRDRQRIEGVLYGAGAIDPLTFETTLQRCTRDFLDILKYEGPNAESKQQVETGNPITAAGHIRLDPSDVAQTLLLSTEVQINEITALMFLLEAHQEIGEVSVEAAAGAYLEQRKSKLACLHRLLQVQALALPDVPDDIFAVVSRYNKSLLSKEEGGGCILLKRLIELIQDTSMEPKDGSSMANVLDSNRQQVSRHLLLQRERTLLCECLLYAARIRVRYVPQDICSTAALLNTLSLRARGSDAGDLTSLQQANVVLVALLQMLLPGEVEEGEAEQEAKQLTALTTNSEIASTLENNASPEDGYGALARLAWSLLMANHGSPNLTARAGEGVKQMLQTGVLGFVHGNLLKSPAFEDEPPMQKQLLAHILNQLVMELLESEPGRASVENLCAESSSEDESRKEGRAIVANGPQPDGIHTLLMVLADIFDVHPNLWLDPQLRYDIVGEFMEHLASTGILNQAANVLEAYLQVLSSLAVSEVGAKGMFLQLHSSRAGMLSWQKMLDVMKQYCDRCALQNDRQGQEDGPSQQQNSKRIVPEEDAKGLAAYLRLFSRVFSELSSSDLEGCTAELEEQANVQPLWEIFFQLMCYPVPQKLKAALDEALTIFVRRPGNVALLWERLLRCIIVRPKTLQDLPSSLPKADITYQLNEIEARAEDYIEALQFIRFLNALLRASEGALPDYGRPYAHFATFVRVDVLGTLHQRVYRKEVQKWELAEACLTHLQLWLEAYEPAAAAEADLQSVPALSVLMDISGERNAMRSLLMLVLPGTEALAAERKDSAAGAAKEGAVLAALRLLRTAMQVDHSTLQVLRDRQKNVFFEPLEVVLKRRIPLLLDYVRYPYHPLIQAEAIRIAQSLVGRLPNLVELLLGTSAPGRTPAYVQIRMGFAACLQDGLYPTAAPEPVPADASSEAQGDKRADLIMQLMLHALEYPTPSFTHLLMGFQVEDGVQGVASSMLDPRRVFTCLTVLLRAVQVEELAMTKARLYECALELLYFLTAAPESSAPMLHLLRQVATLAPQLDAVACCPLPREPDARASALHQRAWILQLIALELHFADTAIPQHRQSVARLLAVLFLPPSNALDGPQRLSRRAEILQQIAYPLQEPNLALECSADARRFQQQMDLDNLLASELTTEEGGVRTVSSRGHLCYNIFRLSQVLRSKYQEAEQDSRRYVTPQGGVGELLKEACHAAIRFAQKYNAFVEEDGGQQAALAAWQTLVEVAVTRRFDMLGSSAVSNGTDEVSEGLTATDVLLGILNDVLEAALHLSSGDGIRLVPALAQVVRTLLARLQEQFAGRLGAADSSSGLQLPAKLHDTLRHILGILKTAHSRPEIRLPLYGALLCYLHICRGLASANMPPTVLTAFIEGILPGTDVMKAAADLDEAQSHVEESNGELLRGETFLVDMLANDAVGLTSNPLAKTLALTLLEALEASDSSATILRSVYAAGLHDRILQDLVNTSPNLLLQVGSKAQAAIQVTVAQAGVLLDFTRASLSLRMPAAQLHLSSLNILSRLRNCQMLDLRPEDPGPESGGNPSTLRARLPRVLLPLLRLVATVVASLPNSRKAKEDAAAFIDAHYTTMLRLLREASTPGYYKTWSPGEQELEQATLVVELMSSVLSVSSGRWNEAQGLKSAVHDLFTRWSTVDSVDNLVISRLPEGKLRSYNLGKPPEQGMAGKVYALRAALAQYLREEVMLPNCGKVLKVENGRPGLQKHEDPSLLLVVDLIHQASSSLFAAVNSMSRHLYDLRSMTKIVAESAVVPVANTLKDNVNDAKQATMTRLAVARAAAVATQDVMLLMFVVENGLAVILYHLRHHSLRIGSPQEVEKLKRILMPQLDPLDQLTEQSELDTARGSALRHLVRRTKDLLASS